ncbi:hypothetical protein PUW25_07635 [Paenibacillus urinalis]|uniref:Lipoprotein YteS n=1 Tax=Paenibacillus urinalis TaxID=521520 RepID=A0ABY7XDG7_9BACL|nr:hypothetical protein [Paenibacillus urinalis]WDI03815.1 hypothetical protein PUW25_07635 [Paenibacillus urinalis]
MRGRWSMAAIMALCVGMLSGCGGVDKFSIFMIDNQGNMSVIAEELETKLQEKLGEATEIEISASPMYSKDKLLVEYAARDHDLIILPEEDMKMYGRDGSNIPLENDFDQEKFSRGVFEGETYTRDENGDLSSDPVVGEHLFGIPLEEMSMFIDLQYAAKNLFATIPISTQDEQMSIEVLKALTE